MTSYVILCLSLTLISVVLTGCDDSPAGHTPKQPDQDARINQNHEKNHPAEENALNYRSLTPEEKRIIIDKGTERPFTGKYTNHFINGYYTCRRCGAKLFTSESKFKSDCGWPSFDDAIAGAVRQEPDADGVRTEILCNACNGHLGHIFQGEGYTSKDTRYCVNSISMDFIPAEQAQQTHRALFAGGCFWGVEYYFQNAPGVVSTTVGYTGGTAEKPAYEEVCSGTTGHVETLEVVFDPAKTNFETLAKLFFEIHDFTQLNRQGPDVGEQYRSVIFYINEEQRQTAQKLIEMLRQKGYDVQTALEPAGQFWPAEDYHQQYYGKKGSMPYCHSRRRIF